MKLKNQNKTWNKHKGSKWYFNLAKTRNFVKSKRKEKRGCIAHPKIEGRWVKLRVPQWRGASDDAGSSLYCSIECCMCHESSQVCMYEYLFKYMIPLPSNRAVLQIWTNIIGECYKKTSLSLYCRPDGTIW